MNYERELKIDRRIIATCGAVCAIALLTLLGLCTLDPSIGRDLDGRYANSPLKEWFHDLTTPGGGRCCDEADGMGINDIDWESSGGHYRVRLEGEWVDVPDDRVVTEPNRAGRAMVWTYRHQDGKLKPRCFMPGEHDVSFTISTAPNFTHRPGGFSVVSGSRGL